MATIYLTESDNKRALTRFSSRVTAYLNNNASDPALVALCTRFVRAYSAKQPNYAALNKLMFNLKGKV